MKRLFTWIYSSQLGFWNFEKKVDGMDLYRSIERIS